MTLPLAGSGVPVISHNLFDLGSIGNPHIPQRPVVVFRQGSYRLFDRSLATPLCRPACDGAPDHGQPARLDKSVSVGLARRRRGAISGGWLSGSKCSSIDCVLMLKYRCLRARGNERRFLSFAPGGLLALPNIILAGDYCYWGRCNPVQRIEGKPFEEKPKHRLPDRVSLARCRPCGHKRFRGGFGRVWYLLRYVGQKAAPPIARANAQRTFRNVVLRKISVRRMR